MIIQFIQLFLRAHMLLINNYFILVKSFLVIKKKFQVKSLSKDKNNQLLKLLL